MIAAVMGVVAISLAVASALHLSGHVHGGGKPYDAGDAGVAEAVIGFVLAGGAVAMLRSPVRARAVGLAATGFAVIGFIVGLSITARGGHLPDIAYHVAVLPVLLGCLVVLLRTESRPQGAVPPGLSRHARADAGRNGSPPG
jgi:hypothetical protein